MSKILQYQQLIRQNAIYSHEFLIILSEQLLSRKRYDHVIRVLDKALLLAELFQCSEYEKYTIQQAVLFHDIAKGMSDKELYDYAQIYDINIEGFIPSVYHALVGAWIAEYFFCVDDQKVLDAIYYHTTGYPSFCENIVGAILFLADYLDPARNIQVTHIMQDIPDHLNKALYHVVKEKLIYVIQRNRIIAKESLLFYHVLLEIGVVESTSKS